MSNQNSNPTSPTHQYEQLTAQHPKDEQYNNVEQQHRHPYHLNLNEHEGNSHSNNNNNNNMNDNLPESVEQQLLNQQIANDNEQNNLQYVNSYPVTSPSRFVSAVHPVSSPYVLQSRTILSPARQFTTSHHAVLSQPQIAHLQAKKLETQVKYEPYEKSVIQYEEVERTIIEYEAVEKKIKVRVPVEKKVTDYRKHEYVVYSDEEKEKKSNNNAQALPYSTLLNSTSKRTFTAPSIPFQSRLLTSTINHAPVNNLRQSTVLLQSQVIRSPFQVQQVVQQQQQQASAAAFGATTNNTVPVSPKTNGVTPKHIAAIVSPRHSAQATFYSNNSFKSANTLTQQYAPAPLTQSVVYQSQLVRSQPFISRSSAPVVNHHLRSHFLSTSSAQKPIWGYFNDRVIHNSKAIKPQTILGRLYK